MSNGSKDTTKGSQTTYSVKPTVLPGAPVVAGTVNVVHSSVCQNVTAQLTVDPTGQLILTSTTAGTSKSMVVKPGQSVPCPYCKQTMTPIEFNMQRMRGGG